MIKILKKIFSKKKKVTPTLELAADVDIENMILWHSMLLKDNECLVYKDSDGVLHYFTTAPIQADKDYIILYMEL